MIRFQALTQWSVSKEPQLALDYILIECSDVTAQPHENIVPAPNLHTIEGVADDAVFALIETDANYPVMWSDPVIEGVL